MPDGWAGGVVVAAVVIARGVGEAPQAGMRADGADGLAKAVFGRNRELIAIYTVILW